MLKSHLTAIGRSKVSNPAQWLLQHELITGSVLDYGCGYGYDALALGADFYDKYYWPDKPKKKYDTIICNYVLNVVSEEEELEILADIRSLLKPGGRAYIAVRRDSFKEGRTTKGTFQRMSRPKLQQLILYPNSFEMYVMWGGNMSFRVWTTRDGRQIALSDMEDSHIENTIRMLRRNLQLIDEGEYTGCFPEDEADEAEVTEQWIEKFRLELLFRRNNIV